MYLEQIRDEVTALMELHLEANGLIPTDLIAKADDLGIIIDEELT